MSTLVLTGALELDILRLFTYGDEHGAITAMFFGDLDMGNARDAFSFLRRTMNGTSSRLTCNLSRLSFVDGTGLRALIACRADGRRDGNLVDIELGANMMLRRIVSMAGVSRLLGLAR